MSAIEKRALRDAFGAFLTGVTVVTTQAEGGSPIGFTANSFASLSLDPPLLLVCLARTSRSFSAFTTASGFAVNILSQDQTDISNTFAKPVEDRFATVEWRRGPQGSPVLGDVAAWFDCSMERVVEGGDHVILIGRVEAFHNGHLSGLGYAAGSYFSPELAQKAVMAASEAEVSVGFVAGRGQSVLLVETSDGKLTLPGLSLSTDEGSGSLAGKLSALIGLKASVGFIYSVYEDRSIGRNHIVYRCELEAGEPSSGGFFALEALPLDRLVDTATGDVLKRYAAESRLGSFGMYVGDERKGRVHTVFAGKVSA